MKIEYTTKLKSQEDLFSLYESLGWNDFLKLNEEQLMRAMNQSWHVIYAYDEEKIVGTGRIVSDGVINAYICGLGVVVQYRSKGIGSEISKRLVEYCKNSNLHTQLFSKEILVPYYENKGFEVFAVGMKVKEK